MEKPNGYDEAKVSGDYIQPELGGHYCQIVQVTETKTKTGKDQIVVLFDFSSRDKQPGLFSAEYKKSTATDKEKKWPFAGTQWILVNDYQEPNKTSSRFKTFCNCVEKSNNFEITWGGGDWAKQFKGKSIGVVYGEKENEYNGKTFMRPVPRWFCQIDAVKDAKIPDPQYLSSNSQVPTSTNPTGMDDFMSIPEGSDDEIPF